MSFHDMMSKHNHALIKMPLVLICCLLVGHGGDECARFLQENLHEQMANRARDEVAIQYFEVTPTSSSGSSKDKEGQAGPRTSEAKSVTFEAESKYPDESKRICSSETKRSTAAMGNHPQPLSFPEVWAKTVHAAYSATDVVRLLLLPKGLNVVFCHCHYTWARPASISNP